MAISHARKSLHAQDTPPQGPSPASFDRPGLLGSLDPSCCLSQEDLEFDPSDYAPAPATPRRTTRAAGRTGLIRYPGGKRKLLGPIASRLSSMFSDLSPEAEYREPFFGAGEVGLALLKQQPGRRAWLNDGDPALAALWDGVVHRAEGLRMMVDLFAHVLDAGYFFLYQKALLSIRTPTDLGGDDPGWIGLAKLAAHQMSFSGLGARAGGPMGGRLQRDPEAIRSRYDADSLCAKIAASSAILTAARLREGTCTNLDFARLFEAPGEAGYYIDPPYYKAGPGLYQFSFSHADHERLAALLRAETRPWLLSYDEHPAVRKLYQGWSRIEELPMGCSINGYNRKVELIISGR